MICVICKRGETVPGRTTVTFDRNGMTLVLKAVPAEVCSNCGEAYIDAEVTQQLLHAADDAARAGVQVDVREFGATAV